MEFLLPITTTQLLISRLMCFWSLILNQCTKHYSPLLICTVNTGPKPGTILNWYWTSKEIPVWCTISRFEFWHERDLNWKVQCPENKLTKYNFVLYIATANDFMSYWYKKDIVLFLTNYNRGILWNMTVLVCYGYCQVPMTLISANYHVKVL